KGFQKLSNTNENRKCATGDESIYVNRSKEGEAKAAYPPKSKSIDCLLDLVIIINENDYNLELLVVEDQEIQITRQIMMYRVEIPLQRLLFIQIIVLYCLNAPKKIR